MLDTRHSTPIARHSRLRCQDAGTPERLSLVGCRLPLPRLVLLLIVVWGLLTIRRGAALARAEAATDGSIYAYCSGLDIPTPPTAPPAELAGLPYEVDNGCLFFRLR
jgi:hypothetical protein